MLPYVLEGLDCSGKKTVAQLVKGVLAENGVKSTLVIGPLVEGVVGRLDHHLANLTREVSASSLLGRCRRIVYVAGPCIDRYLYRTPADTVIIKISSHYRTWARAIVEGDRLMTRAFQTSSWMHPRFAGGTFLYANFFIRIARHRADFKNGRTAKAEVPRFFGYDSHLFERWDSALHELLTNHVGKIQRIDTTAALPHDIAQKVAMHAITCWQNAGEWPRR